MERPYPSRQPSNSGHPTASDDRATSNGNTSSHPKTPPLDARVRGHDAAEADFRLSRESGNPGFRAGGSLGMGSTLSADQSQDSTSNGSGAASPTVDSDHALVAACCAGDTPAFDLLVLRHQDFVSTLARRLLRDPHEAEDLTQETFLRAYEKIEEFRGEAQFSTWLHRICCNLCLNRLRKKKNELTNDMAVEAIVQEFPHPSSTVPDQVLITKERQKLVQRALGQMTREFREVLLLHNRVHLSYEEIAQRLRLPVGTVRSRLHRGREELKKRLRSYLQDGG